MMKRPLIGVGLFAIISVVVAASLYMLLEIKNARDDIAQLQATMNERFVASTADFDRIFDTQYRHNTAIENLSLSNRRFSERLDNVSVQASSPAESALQSAEQDYSQLPQPSADASVDDDRLLTSTQMMQMAVEQERQRKAFFTDHFEQLDQSNWSQATEGLIESTLSDPAFQHINVISRACKASMCRLEIIHDDGPDSEMAVDYDLVGRLSSEMPRMSSTRELLDDGRVKTTLFLTRRGVIPPRYRPDQSNIPSG